MSEQPDQRITELEIRLTYQQKLIDELNGVLTDQTMKLLRLEKKVAELLLQQDQLRSHIREQMPNLPNEKPPHY